MWFNLFLVSSLINALAAFYVVWLLKTVAVINEDVEDVSQLLRDFTQHVETVNELEMFYGDETLGALLMHSKELSEKLSDLDLILNTKEDESDEGGSIAEEKAS